jgi:hypothetical protein
MGREERTITAEGTEYTEKVRNAERGRVGVVFLDLESRLAEIGARRNARGIEANPPWLDARESGVKLLVERIKRDKGA